MQKRSLVSVTPFATAFMVAIALLAFSLVADGRVQVEDLTAPGVYAVSGLVVVVFGRWVMNSPNLLGDDRRDPDAFDWSMAAIAGFVAPLTVAFIAMAFIATILITVFDL